MASMRHAACGLLLDRLPTADRGELAVRVSAVICNACLCANVRRCPGISDFRIRADER
jgi:hypothetical protein